MGLLMASASSSRRSQRRRQKRLFQSNTLTVLFGRSGGTLLTRVVFIVAAIGALTIITVGLLRPNTAPGTTSRTLQSSSSAPVGLQIGDIAPNFPLTGLDGKQVSLSDYRGKPVVLNFWYAACPGCLEEIPGM